MRRSADTYGFLMTPSRRIELARLLDREPRVRVGDNGEQCGKAAACQQQIGAAVDLVAMIVGGQPLRSAIDDVQAVDAQFADAEGRDLAQILLEHQSALADVRFVDRLERAL